MTKKFKLKRLHHSQRVLLPGMTRASRVAFMYGLLLGLLILAALSAYAVYGPENNPVQGFCVPHEQSKLGGYLAALETQTQSLREESERAQELAKLDNEARAKMNLMISNLEAENAHLKEDLAFFEGFIPGSLQGAVSLKRLQVSNDTVPGQYRYKALIIQGSQRPEVQLDIQILIKVLNNNKAGVIVLPSAGNISDPQYKIKLTRFSRVSGIFTVNQNTKVLGVEMRLLESGVIRAQSTIKL